MKVSFTTHPARNENVLEYVKECLKQGIKTIHIDFMDGKITPSKASSIKEFKQLANTSLKTNFLVHIMAKTPEKWVKRFADAGANNIVFQIEAAKKPLKLLQDKKCKIGIAIDLPTKIETIDENVIKLCDYVLIMLVKFGASGQEIDFGALKKVEQIRNINKKAKIILDGGINEKTIKKVSTVKPDVVSLGSYGYNLIKQNKTKKFLETIKTL